MENSLDETTVQFLPDSVNSSMEQTSNVRNPQSMRQSAPLKTSIAVVVWFICVNATLIAGIIKDKNGQCAEYNLDKWATGQVVIQFIMILLHIGIQSCMRCCTGPNSISLTRARCSSCLYILTRLLNIMWLVWVATGATWTFQGSSCKDSIPTLYMMCFVISIIHLILIGLPVLFCCCTIPLVIMVYACCPSWLNANGETKLSKKSVMKLIKSNTRRLKYTLGAIDQEDATCAICLCEYEENEEIRYLPCKHHFHATCIDQWFLTTKSETGMSCPLCKHSLNEKTKKKAETTTETPPAADDPITTDNTNNNNNTISEETV